MTHQCVLINQTSISQAIGCEVINWIHGNATASESEPADGTTRKNNSVLFNVTETSSCSNNTAGQSQDTTQRKEMKITLNIVKRFNAMGSWGVCSDQLNTCRRDWSSSNVEEKTRVTVAQTEEQGEPQEHPWVFAVQMTPTAFNKQSIKFQTENSREPPLQNNNY